MILIKHGSLTKLGIDLADSLGVGIEKRALSSGPFLELNPVSIKAPGMRYGGSDDNVVFGPHQAGGASKCFPFETSTFSCVRFNGVSSSTY